MSDTNIPFSNFLEEIIASLNQLKEPSFAKGELEEKGITSSFQNLPCTFNISLTKRSVLGTTTTCMRSELQHILTEKTMNVNEKATNEKYLTYVKVGIDHNKSSSMSVFLESRIVRLFCVILIVLLILGGSLCVVQLFTRQKNRVEMKSVLQSFDGTNLIQKCEIGIKQKWNEPMYSITK